MLSIFLVWSLVIPKQSYAVIPLVAMGVQAVTAAGLTLSAADVAGLAIAAAGAGALLYMKLTAPDGSSIAIPAQDAAINPVAVIPPPPVPASVPALAVFSISATGLESVDLACGLPLTNSDGVSACNAYSCNTARVQAINNGGTFVSSSGVFSAPANCVMTYSINYGGAVYNYGGGAGISMPSSINCPAGYGVSGSTCALSNPRAAVDDDRQDFGRNGAAYTPAAGDLAGTIQGIQGTTSSSGDSLSFVGTSGGQPSSLTVVAQVGGGTLITQTTQAADLSGATYLKQSAITLDSSGAIVATSTANLTGSINTATAGANGGAEIISAPSGAITPNPAAPAPFPSDYARTGEAASAAQGVKDELAGTADTRAAVVTGGAITGAATLVTQYGQQAQDVTDRANGFGLPSLPSWVFPEVAPIACVPPAFTWGGHTITYDICPHVPAIKAIMAWVLYMLTAALCFAMVMSFRATRLRGG